MAGDEKSRRVIMRLRRLRMWLQSSVIAVHMGGIGSACVLTRLSRLWSRTADSTVGARYRLQNSQGGQTVERDSEDEDCIRAHTCRALLQVVRELEVLCSSRRGSVAQSALSGDVVSELSSHREQYSKCTKEVQKALIALFDCIDAGALFAEGILEDFDAASATEEALKLLQESLQDTHQHGAPPYNPRTCNGSNTHGDCIPPADYIWRGSHDAGSGEIQAVKAESDLRGILFDLIEIHRERRAALAALHQQALLIGWQDRDSGDLSQRFN